VKIRELSLKKDVLQPGEPVEGAVAIEGADPAETLSLTVTCRDNWGRLLAETQPAVRGALKISFELKPLRPLTAEHVIEATLMRTNEVLARTEKTFYVPGVFQKKQPFQFLVWAGAYVPTFAYPDQLVVARNLGFDICFSGTNFDLAEHTRYQPEANLRLGLMSLNRVVVHDHSLPAKYQKTRDQSLLVRNPCLSDPEYRHKITENLKANAALTAGYGALTYMLGDEMSLTTEGGNSPLDICFSKYCLAGFRGDLQKRFGAIGNLNQAWHSSYRSFDEIVPLTWEEAAEKKDYAPWLAHRDYMETVYADMFRWTAEAVKSGNPAGLIGESGIESKVSAYGGYDWAKRMKIEKAVCFYGLGDIPISFADRSTTLLGSWSGYMSREAEQQFLLWRALLHGQNTLGYWYLPLLVKPDLSLTPGGEFTRPYLKEIKEGIGDALGRSEFRYSPIAIHYSQRSCHLSFLLKQRSEADTYRAYVENLDRWNAGLRAAGYIPRFVSPEQIETGGLSKMGYRTLILPLAWILSDREAEQIRAFVDGGGLVIADAQTGLYDEFGRERPQGALDGIFGLKRKNSRITPEVAEFTAGTTSFSSQFSERGVETTGEPVARGKAKTTVFGGISIGGRDESAPTPSVARSGRGKALYLAGAKIDFGRIPNFLGDFLESAGITPPAKVSGSDGLRLPVEIGHFRETGVDYIGILCLPENVPGVNIQTISMKELAKKSAPVTISFREEGRIYEVRGKKYLGQGRSVSDEITPGVVKLYAVIKEEPGLALSLQPIDKPGLAVPFVVRSRGKGKYPAFLSVREPNGSLVPYLSRALSVSGELRDVIPLALNSPRGTWRVLVTDVITGKESSATFVVQ